MLIKIAGLDVKPYRQSDFSFEILADELDLSAPDCDFVGKVMVRGMIGYTGTVYRLTGQIVYRKAFVCARCLKSCSSDEEVDFSEDFVPKGSADESGDETVTAFVGDCLNIDAVVRDNVLASQPLAHLCKSDCKGLCPVCGQDLNVRACACETTVIDPRLAKLLEFKPSMEVL